MKNELPKILHLWQSEIIGAAGVLIHALLRRDVPIMHHAIMVVIGLPLTIYVIAPGISEWFGFSAQTEKAIVFVLALWGRDILIGTNRLFKQFSKDPLSLWMRK